MLYGNKLTDRHLPQIGCNSRKIISVKDQNRMSHSLYAVPGATFSVDRPNWGHTQRKRTQAKRKAVMTEQPRARGPLLDEAGGFGFR